MIVIERCDKTIDMFDYPIFNPKHVYGATELVVYKGLILLACDAMNRYYLENRV